MDDPVYDPNLKIPFDELRPCARCRGVLTPIFYIVRVQAAVVDARAIEGVLGVTQITGSLGVAKVLAPRADDVVRAVPEATRLFVCADCYLQGGLAAWSEAAAHVDDLVRQGLDEELRRLLPEPKAPAGAAVVPVRGEADE